MVLTVKNLFLGLYLWQSGITEASSFSMLYILLFYCFVA